MLNRSFPGLVFYRSAHPSWLAAIHDVGHWWEIIELVLPFGFALESINNKAGDIYFNIMGYGAGLYIRSRSKN